MSRLPTRNCFLDGAVVFCYGSNFCWLWFRKGWYGLGRCGAERCGVRSGAVLDGGCLGQLLGQISFLKENSDSAVTNRSKQKEGASGEQVIES